MSGFLGDQPCSLINPKYPKSWGVLCCNFGSDSCVSEPMNSITAAGNLCVINHKALYQASNREILSHNHKGSLI